MSNKTHKNELNQKDIHLQELLYIHSKSFVYKGTGLTKFQQFELLTSKIVFHLNIIIWNVRRLLNLKIYCIRLV